MRILIVTQYFWPENFRITDLANALKEKGHEVTILTAMPNYPAGKLYEGYSWWKKRRESMQGIPIIRVPIFVRRESRSWQLVLNYLSFVLSACLLAPWLLRKKQFDVIFTYEPSPVTVAIPAIMLAKIKKASMFFWVQDLWPETLAATGAITSPRILSVVGKMVKSIYRCCDCILVQSKSFVEPAIAVGAEREKIKYFPNWAEALYRPVQLGRDAIERREVPTDDFVVMFAGNLGAAQSLDTIIAAAEKLKEENIQWIFLGNGRSRDWLQDMVTAKQLNKVHLLGSRPMETMPNYFSLADVMLVTLKDDPVMASTIPGKMQSYLACGRPIIGALNGAGAEVIDGSFSGYSVAADDIDGLVESVLKMSKLSDKERNDMGASARLYYENNFDRNMLVHQLELWMEEHRK
ncbi:MAG: glycosyltransferase [Methylococcaceae bacterium]|nr:glycosyltransferase [Methylococcaceae bacterium]